MHTTTTHNPRTRAILAAQLWAAAATKAATTLAAMDAAQPASGPHTVAAIKAINAANDATRWATMAAKCAIPSSAQWWAAKAFAAARVAVGTMRQAVQTVAAKAVWQAGGNRGTMPAPSVEGPYAAQCTAARLAATRAAQSMDAQHSASRGTLGDMEAACAASIAARAALAAYILAVRNWEDNCPVAGMADEATGAAHKALAAIQKLEQNCL